MTEVDTITLPIEVISRNRIDKYHWSKKTALRRTYQLLIRNQMNLNKITRIKESIKFNLVIIGTRKRDLDFDNFVGGCKQLVDALVHEGFIFDDDNKHLGIPKFIQLKVKKGNDPSVTIIRKKHGD